MRDRVPAKRPLHVFCRWSGGALSSCPDRGSPDVWGGVPTRRWTADGLGLLRFELPVMGTSSRAQQSSHTDGSQHSSFRDPPKRSRSTEISATCRPRRRHTHVRYPSSWDAGGPRCPCPADAQMSTHTLEESATSRAPQLLPSSAHPQGTVPGAQSTARRQDSAVGTRLASVNSACPGHGALGAGEASSGVPSGSGPRAQPLHGLGERPD